MTTIKEIAEMAGVSMTTVYKCTSWKCKKSIESEYGKNTSFAR